MHRYSRPLLIAATGFLVILAIGAFLPREILHQIAGQQDGILHGAGAGIATFLVVLALPGWWASWAGFMLAATGVVEVVQPIFHRSAQWSDFWASTAGLLVGMGLAAAVLLAVGFLRHDGWKNWRQPPLRIAAGMRGDL